MNRTRAFTIVELLVVIAIMGTLTAVLTVNLSRTKQRSRDAERKNELRTIRIGMESYFSAQSVPRRYPVSSPTPSAGTTGLLLDLSGTTNYATSALVPNYMFSLPVDPTNSGNYRYRYQFRDGGYQFTLFATLENSLDKAGWYNSSGVLQTSTQTNGYQLRSEQLGGN